MKRDKPGERAVRVTQVTWPQRAKASKRARVRMHIHTREKLALLQNLADDARKHTHHSGGGLKSARQLAAAALALPLRALIGSHISLVGAGEERWN